MGRDGTPQTASCVHPTRLALTGPSYLFDAPSGISSDGTDVWVPNSADNSVTGFLA